MFLPEDGDLLGDLTQTQHTWNNSWTAQLFTVSLWQQLWKPHRLS